MNGVTAAETGETDSKGNMLTDANTLSTTNGFRSVSAAAGSSVTPRTCTSISV